MRGITREQRNAGIARVIARADTEHYLVIVYADRKAREAAVTALGLPPETRYLSGEGVSLRRRGAAGLASSARSLDAAPANKAGATG